MQQNFSRFVRIYRTPLLATGLAAAGVAAVALGGQQYVKAHTETYYQVIVEGETIGDVSSRDKVESWLAAKAIELDRADTPVRRALVKGQVGYRAERAYKADPDDDATLAKLAGRVRTMPVGVEVIVDGKVVGIVRDRETAFQVLNRIKAPYAPEPAHPETVGAADRSAAKFRTLSFSEEAPAQAQPFVSSVEFLEDVDLEEKPLGEADGLTDPDELYEKLATGNPKPVAYTVEEGDCLVCIAEKLNVSTELIYDNNPWIEKGKDLLRIGDKLDLTVMSPLLNVKTVEQATENEPIEARVEYEKSEDMRVGQSKVIREGRDGKKQVTYLLVKRNGNLVEEKILSENVLVKPISTIVLKGTKVVAGEGTGKFSWPVLGARITSYMGKRWGRMHNGIDLVGRSSILAADNGVIEFAGYQSGGLGNAVIIDHKNGFKTVYGHMKKLKVKKGQIVEKGDTIGIMGSTGRSTGTHLHFEIYQNGKRKNPTNFL